MIDENTSEVEARKEIEKLEESDTQLKIIKAQKASEAIHIIKYVDELKNQQLQDAQNQIDILEHQVKNPLIDSLLKDSLFYYERADLEKLGIDDLKTLSDALKNAISCGCKDALEDHKRMLARKNPVRGRVGSFNQDTGEWEGGEIV